MQTISKIDGALKFIRNKYKAHSISINLILIIVYLVLIGYYIMFIPPIASTTWVMEKEFIWYKMYKIINPFTIGTYIWGSVVLCEYVIRKNIIFRILVSLFYGMIIFIPHVLIVPMCIVILYRERSISPS